MLSSDPRLPQLSEVEAANGAVPVPFYRRFQERFYMLWRELSRNDEELRARVDSGEFTYLHVKNAQPNDTKVLIENTSQLLLMAENAVVDVGSVTNHPLSLFTNNTEWLRLTTDGRFYGKALHNNAGSVTGTTNQYIASGTQANGNATAVTNINGTPTYSTMTWLRVGNVVTVAGAVTAEGRVANTESVIRFALPIASSFTVNEDCSGTGYWTDGATTGLPVRVRADATNDQAEVRWVPSSTTSVTMPIHFTYLIK